MDTSQPDMSEAALAGEGPRRVRLSVLRIEPLSALKVGFLISFAMGLMLIVAAAFLWVVLDAMHVFSSLEGFVSAVGAGSLAGLLDLLHFSRVVSLVVIVAVGQVIILSLLSWMAAVIYNLIAHMVGGIHLVLSDE